MAAPILVQPTRSVTSDRPSKHSVYEIVTEKIIAQLEQGVIPWHQPWAAVGAPVNLPTGRRYRGINVLLLSCAGYSSPYWMTYRQGKLMGGQVRGGEKSTLIVFWKWLEVDSEPEPESEETVRRIPFLRYYRVFNLEQVDGIPPSRIPAAETRPVRPLAAAQALVDAMPNPPRIAHGGDKAFYRPSTDSIQMPKPEAFDSPETFHATLFHELTHASGHPSRLGRFDLSACLAPFGSAEYSREELIAEVGAAFLCAEAGIENATLTNSAAYIQNWLGVLKNDRRMVVLAAAQAQRAVDLILNRSQQEVAVGLAA